MKKAPALLSQPGAVPNTWMRGIEMTKPIPTAERFWSKVHRTDDCWLWTDALNAKGYGQFKLGPGRMVKPHRMAYELSVGPIPDGLVIDHLCRVRHCVNPAHMEPVSIAENTRRGDATPPQARVNREKTHCPQGHAYDEANTGHYRGRRYCRTCQNEYSRRRRARQKA